MDYRNADGSKAEMCGNGIRVFARYLADAGLADARRRDRSPIGTRAGVQDADPQRPRVRGRPRARGASSETTSSCAPAASASPRPGLGHRRRQPARRRRAARHRRARRRSTSRCVPQLHPEPPHGANVEFVVPSDPLVRDGVGLDPDARVRARRRRDPQLRHGRRRGRPRGAALGGPGGPDRWTRRGAGRHARRADARECGRRRTCCCRARRRSSTRARSRSPELERVAAGASATIVHRLVRRAVPAHLEHPEAAARRRAVHAVARRRTSPPASAAASPSRGCAARRARRPTARRAGGSSARAGRAARSCRRGSADSSGCVRNDDVVGNIIGQHGVDIRRGRVRRRCGARDRAPAR